MPSLEEAEAEDSGVGLSIAQAEVTELVKELLCGKAPGVDEFHSEYLKSLDVVGVSWLTRLCSIVWQTGTVPLDWQTGVSLGSTVDVKLDPNTAHKRLALSEDRKEEISDSSGRFDLFGSVLGLNGFSSGRSYWEVEVGNKTGWDLGVATGGASRKGKLTLSPENGYWVLVHYEEEKYAAMASVPLSLFLKENPTRVGLFVDYKEGLVSFYDVRAQSHIYSFTECSFKEELYPYFSPHLRVEEKNQSLNPDKSSSLLLI
uniref:B30.2/SPRY domain-containing protein n=1 Tax=Oryzias melastigma TaxID=30732 RepID=A0A3B3CPX9_ORYME